MALALLCAILAAAPLSVRLPAHAVELCRGEVEVVPVKVEPPAVLRRASAAGGRVSCQVLVERRYRLEPFDVRRHTAPLRGLWLRITAPQSPGNYTVVITVADTAGHQSAASLAVRVWPVRLPEKRNFDFEPYYPGVFWLAGGYDPTPQALRRLEAHLRLLRRLRTTCCNWTAVPWELARRAKIAATGQPLPEAAKARPGEIGVTWRPELDFSALDAFCRLPRRYGLGRLRTVLLIGPPGRIETFCQVVSGKKFPADSPEARSVIAYFYRQLARYWASRGFRGVYCKISDEIGPDWVDEYLKWAAVARRAGLRPYTTITSWLPFSPRLLTKMNPLCDQWQVGVGYMRQFRSLTESGWAVEWAQRTLAGPWLRYTNGGARDTWAMTGVFTDRDPPIIISPHLTVDGQRLTLIAGPWGNRRRGVWTTHSSAVYISLPDGSDPNAAAHRIVLRYGLLERREGARPALHIDPSDWVIYYGGGSKPYRADYLSRRAFPWNMALHGTDGYAFWCYRWYPDTERLGWLDDELRWTPSPAFEGLRDGNEDLALYFLAARALGSGKLREPLFGAGRLKVARRVFPWPVNTLTETVAADNPYSAFQAARRLLLHAVIGR